VVQEVDPDDFGGNKNGFGMFAADDDALACKKPRGIDGVPQLFVYCRVALSERVNRSIREMKPDGQRGFSEAGLWIGSHKRDGIVFSSKGEAVAAQAEKPGVAVSRSFDPREELMRGVCAAVLMTFGVVLMCDRHTGSCGLAHVERRAVAAEHFHW